MQRARVRCALWLTAQAVVLSRSNFEATRSLLRGEHLVPRLFLLVPAKSQRLADFFQARQTMSLCVQHAADTITVLCCALSRGPSVTGRLWTPVRRFLLCECGPHLVDKGDGQPMRCGLFGCWHARCSCA